MANQSWQINPKLIRFKSRFLVIFGGSFGNKNINKFPNFPPIGTLQCLLQNLAPPHFNSAIKSFKNSPQTHLMTNSSLIAPYYPCSLAGQTNIVWLVFRPATAPFPLPLAPPPLPLATRRPQCGPKSTSCLVFPCLVLLCVWVVFCPFAGHGLPATATHKLWRSPPITNYHH